MQRYFLVGISTLAKALSKIECEWEREVVKWCFQCPSTLEVGGGGGVVIFPNPLVLEVRAQ